MAPRHQLSRDPAAAWAPYAPDAARPWTLARASHLYRRAAFGARAEDLVRALAGGPEQAVAELLAPPGDLTAFDRARDADETAACRSGRSDAVRDWWLRRMILSPHPLRERMALLWHAHFALDAAQVKEAPAVRRHVALLREHALGSYRSLVEAMVRDPALLASLGAAASRRGQPAEGLARALLERWTVGAEHCAEEDVREAARAFTGTFVRGDEVIHVAREHDGGVKRVLGRTGPFTGEDVVQIALAHPATAETVVRRLWRAFVSEVEEPAPALLAPLARSFAAGLDLGRLAGTILRSSLFFSDAARGQRITSPVELAVGLVRSLEGLIATSTLARDLDRLGQRLLHPPTARGWAGGPAWIDRVTLLRRQALAAALLAEGGAYGGRLDPREVAARHGHADVNAAADFLADLLLPEGGEAVRSAARAELSRGAPGEALRRFAIAIARSPEYQLS
ncbi:MAG: DUF1800 family protein [Planctomycetota bacterium]